MKEFMLKKMFHVLLFVSMICLVASCGSSSSYNNQMQNLIDKATEVVRADYPATFLYEATGTVHDGHGFSVTDITKWKFVYHNDVPPHTTVILEQNNGVFGKPEFFGRPWGGDMPIDQPLVRDLEQAINLLHNAGYKKRFSVVVLRKPLYPGVEENFYIFTMPEDRMFVAVGDRTGTVMIVN